jgi:YVTN family beta-propeller protein
MSYLRKAGYGSLIIAAVASLYPVVTAPRMESEVRLQLSPNSEQSKNTASGLSNNALDFDFFKSMVEPIFLKERPGHARCYGCHSQASRIFHLEQLSAGSATWTEEQSRQNFQTVSRLVTPGNPYDSLLLIHPLAPEAGGDGFHSGGRQFETQNDPDWLTLAEWVRSAHAPADPNTKPAALIYVTNSAGNTIDVVDPTTNTVVQTIRGIELPTASIFLRMARVCISAMSPRACLTSSTANKGKS